MPTTQEFLQAVLPATGAYCYTTIVNGIARNVFVSDIHTLSSEILRVDKRLDSGAVYHACASYDLTGHRRQANVVAVKSLWLDIDVGEGKGYGALNGAISHLSHFVGRYLLPKPILVCSGTGLHAYWPLSRDLSREEWLPIAQALKQACHTFGLAAGPERTADCASILRPPGTTHRKTVLALPVVCGPLNGPYAMEAFNGLGIHSVRRPVGTRLVGTSNLRHKANLSDYLNVHAPEVVDFELLASNCGQFRIFRDTSGNIAEPLWYSLLGALGFAYDGSRVAHEWSRGHSKYSFEETEGRLDRVKQLSGPTTCAHIKSLNPKGCEGCAFGSSTPLEAGRQLILQTALPNFLEETSSIQAPQTPELCMEGMAIEGYSEYKFIKGGLYYVTEGNDNRPSEVKLSSYPVRISSVHVGEINKEQYYYLLQHYKPHNGWHDVVVKPSQMHGQGMMATMADLGVVVHDPTKFLKYIKDSVDSINGKRRAEMSYEQFGWKGSDKFLYGATLYNSGGTEGAAISPELRLRAQWLKPSVSGSLGGWKQAVDCLMGRGSEGMSFTVLASFASVLMPFFEANEGGAVINLMTRHSGAGKSTALAGATTVWASDPRALELITIDTKVSKAITLGALCNLPCIYDEFDNKDPEVVREFITMFTSGRDKMRGNSDATITHTSSAWRMMLLTASNASIAETIMSLGRSDAPAMRILELPVESSGTMKPSELVALSKQLYANAGHAGEAFIQYLVQPGVIEWVRERLNLLLDEIFAECHFSKEHRFWARALAAIGCAAIIVEQLELISFSTDRIMKWALDHFRQNAPIVATKPIPMLELLANYLNDSLGQTLTMPGPAQGRTLFTVVGNVPRSEVNVRIELKGSTCYVAEQPLRKWLESHGGGYQELIRDLKHSRMLIADKYPKTLTAGTEIQGGQVRCVVFDIGSPKFSGVLREVEREAGVPLMHKLRGNRSD